MNFLTLILKKFIWNCKFKNERRLSIVGFKNFLVYILVDLKNMYDSTNKPANFNEWNDLFVRLTATADLDHHGQPLAQVHPLLPQAVPP